MTTFRFNQRFVYQAIAIRLTEKVPNPKRLSGVSGFILQASFT
jgi:hypothetical protein